MRLCRSSAMNATVPINNRVTNETDPESPSTPSIILSELMTPITAKIVIGITA